MALLQPTQTSSISSLLGRSFFVVFTAYYCCCCVTITTCAFVTVPPGILLTTTMTTATNTRDNNNNNPTPVAPTVGVGSTSTAADDDVIHTHDWREVSVQIPKPLGLIIEEVDATDPSQGVEIVQIARDGNTAATNRQKQQQPRKTITNTTDDATMKVVCVGDRIRVVNGVKCSTYDEVMEQIVSSSDHHPIALLLGRPSDSVVVQFQFQQGSSSESSSSTLTNGVSGVSGVCVTAQPGDYLGNIANQPGIDYPIQYSCRTGRCGICEQSLSFLLRTTAKKKKKKTDGTTTTIQQQQCHSQTVRPCVYRIPKNKNIISMQISAAPTAASSKNRVVSP